MMTQMPNRMLGHRGLEVSALGLGCMGLSEFYGPTNETEAIRVLERALALGVTFWDTADMYGMGHNEELLGRFLKNKRDRVVLATKCGIVRDPSQAQVRSIRNDPDYVKSACEASLRRLRTETIDLYYLHRIDRDVPVEESVGALAELVSEGKVRHVGLSEVSPATLKRAQAVHPITAVQSEYSLWTRDPEVEVLSTCRQLGVGFVSYSPLGRGFLTSHFQTDLRNLAPDDFRRLVPRFQGENLQGNLELRQKFMALAERLGITGGQLALAWILAQAEEIVPIPGTKRIAYLEENVQATEVCLDKATLTELSELFPIHSARGLRYPEAAMASLDG